MGRFPEFEAVYGPPENCTVPGERDLARYQEILPDELLAQWHDTGWCSYGDGLLWLVDPAQFRGVLEDWLEIVGPTPLVFLRSAFAHLYFWHDGAVHSLDVQHGSVSQVTKRISRIFSLLCDPEIMEKILHVSLYQEALPRLGQPASDECYAFEPALALGGPGTVETVRRAKIREHLAFLAQLVR